MIDFLTIVLIIFGVLQIILFFKMWGMTNNVKEIKRRYFEELEISRQKKKDFPVSTSRNTELNIEKKSVLTNPIVKPAIITKAENVQTPTREPKHYDIAEKDINKLKVLKKRGFIEQATNELIILTSASKEDALNYINYL